MIATVLATLLLLQGQTVRPGAVSGHLRTVDGVPAVNTRVVALPAPKVGISVGDALNYFDPYYYLPTNYTLTDNEGNFRLQDLEPGRYFLMGGALGHGTFFPDAPDMLGAQILEVRSGYEIDNLNFQLQTRLGGKLSGRIEANMAELGPRLATVTGGTLEELLEVPVGPDGAFQFGHVPPGKYLVSLWPPTPGIASMPITVGDADISGVQLVPLPTQKVTGRIRVRNGAIPHGLLGFYTEKTWVGGEINPDGTFSVDLHSATHQIDFAGLPVGYDVEAVTVDSKDASQGIAVGKQDVSNVVIELSAPKRLAVVRGRISGLQADRFASTIVEMTGPTFNRIQADVQPDATFEFPAVVPGSYYLTLRGVPDVKPISVVVDGFRTFEVSVTVPGG